MMESRLAKIILLDGRQLDFYITPEILTSDLLDMIASYLNLKDKEYFGVSYIDATSHRNWLQLDKKVLDHDLPKKNSLLVLFFRVKFYLESIALTKDKTAVELFYQQAKQAMYQNEIEISNDLVYELTALVLQSLYGDYKNDTDALKHLKAQNILSKQFLNSPSSAQKERKIISFYKKCTSMNRGQCIVNYLSIIEKLNNYGVHYYEVKDKSNTRWYLGISFRGIGLYEINNKITPKKLFLWSRLENLYYRDRKFSIEVHETSLSQVKETQTQVDNQTTDTFNPVKVYAWFASIPSLCKSIWLMAVSQHQFYLDKKQNKDVLLQYKSLNDLAHELTNNNNTSTNQNETNTNLDNVDLLINNEDTYNEKSQMLFLLKKKQEILNQQLNVKKTICDKIRMKQQDIIEMSKLIQEDKSCIYSVVSMVNELKQMLNEFQQNKYTFQLILDEEYETQKKIMFIALNLASDPSVTSTVQKARREFYEKSKVKFSKLEQKREAEQKLIENGFNTISTSSTTTNSNQQNQSNNINKKPSYFNDDVISMFDSISPASIHRKDSYRRAQEQKLFLENNMNLMHKTNRNLNGRRVRHIWNESLGNNNLLSYCGNGDSTSIKISNSDNVFVNNLYDVKSFKDEFLDMQPQIKSKSVSPNEFLFSNVTSNGNGIHSNLGTNSKGAKSNNNNNNNNSNIKNGDTNIDVKFELNSSSSFNNLKKEINNCKYSNNSINNIKNTNHNGLNNHHKIDNNNLTTDIYQAEFIENINDQINEISLKDQVSNFSLGLKKPAQRKNTSDSNMKLLADHNFYHISNKRADFSSSSSSSQSIQNHKNINLTYRDICNTNNNETNGKFSFKYHNSNSNINNNTSNFNSLSLRPTNELTEFFNKYNSVNKYKRGMNSSSNSLVSLNESSVSPIEELNYTHSDKDNHLIRSNPDLNDACITTTSTTTTTTSTSNLPIIKPKFFSNSPKNNTNTNNLSSPVNSNGSSSSSSNNNTNNKIKRFESQTSEFHLNNITNNNNGSNKKDCYSNNGSLNLSIHTAEEFSIEMLSWLKNEVSVKKIINEEKLDQIDQATLV